MSFRAIFEGELRRLELQWCRGCCAANSHARGFVLHEDRKTVHLDSEIATRYGLHRGLHEIAHCILDERGLRRHEKEAQANRWAKGKMREFHIPVPRQVSAAGRSYVQRMKRWGDNIKKGASR